MKTGRCNGSGVSQPPGSMVTRASGGIRGPNGAALRMFLSLITFVLLALGGFFSLITYLPGISRFHPHHPQALAGMCLLLGAAGAVLWIAQVRRQSRKIIRAIEQIKEEGLLQPITANQNILRPLAQALNE